MEKQMNNEMASGIGHLEKATDSLKCKNHRFRENSTRNT